MKSQEETKVVISGREKKPKHLMKNVKTYGSCSSIQITQYFMCTMMTPLFFFN